MLTIGQLAGYVGVTTKTIRFYHRKALMPEPPRDASGYRRYTAQDAIDLIKIRTLAEAGVPLARIRELRSASTDELRASLRAVDADLAERIGALARTRRRLRALEHGEQSLLPDGVGEHVEQLRGLGFSSRWLALQADLWILVFATHPDVATGLLRDQARMLADPTLRQVVLDYDRAHDLSPDDPLIDDLAERIVAATRQRYGSGDLPGQVPGSPIPALVQGVVNDASPGWRRLDTLIRTRLGGTTTTGSR